MPATIAAEDLERRKQLRVRLRPNLIVTPLEQGAAPSFIIKDPISLRYFRLDQKQRFLIDLMDGAHTLENIQAAFEAQFPPERITLEELETFAAQLLHAGLALIAAPRYGAALFDRSQDQRAQAIRGRLLNFFSIKIPLFDPDLLLGGL